MNSTFDNFGMRWQLHDNYLIESIASGFDRPFDPSEGKLSESLDRNRFT